jgi:hypothetical protein
MDEARRTLDIADRPAPEQLPHPAPDQTRGMPEPADPRLFWSWLRFWVQMAVLAVLAIGGAFFASGGKQPGDYQSGLMLAVAAFILAVLLVKQRLDGAPDDWASLVLVDDMHDLAFVIPLFTIAALAGLFIADAFPTTDPRYFFGLGLFLASIIAILLQIRHVFDRIDRGGG